MSGNRVLTAAGGKDERQSKANAVGERRAAIGSERSRGDGRQSGAAFGAKKDGRGNLELRYALHSATEGRTRRGKRADNPLRFREFMDLAAHMKLRWHSAPYKRIVTNVLSAPAAICHAAASQMRMAASGGTRLTHPKGWASRMPETALKEEGSRLTWCARRLKDGSGHGSSKRPTPCLKPRKE